MLGSALHLSMFFKALVFKWKVCQRKGLEKAKSSLFFILTKSRPLKSFVKNNGGKVWSFCSSFNLFISGFISGLFEVIFYYRHHSLSPLFFILTAPEGNRQQSLGKGWIRQEREIERQTHTEWMINAKKIRFTVRESRSTMTVMVFTSHTQLKVLPHNHKRRQELFCMPLFYPVDSFCFIRDVIKKAKPAAQTWGYTAHSTISIVSSPFIIHDNFPTKNSFISLMFLVFVEVPCLLFKYFYPSKPRLCMYHLLQNNLPDSTGSVKSAAARP